MTLFDDHSIEQACLRLQSHHHLNINMLLFCCWTGFERYGRLERRDIRQALQAINRWHEMITLSLRQLRRQCHKYPLLTGNISARDSRPGDRSGTN